MGFNTEAFMAADFAARTEAVPFPNLAEFFADGETAEFLVRGLSANEVLQTHAASTKQNGIDAVVKAIASQKDQVELIRRALGLSGDILGETARRIELLVLGCVAPKLTHAHVVKLAEKFPSEFIGLTTKIAELSAQGACRVKPQPSSPVTPL